MQTTIGGRIRPRRRKTTVSGWTSSLTSAAARRSGKKGGEKSGPGGLVPGRSIPFLLFSRPSRGGAHPAEGNVGRGLCLFPVDQDRADGQIQAFLRVRDPGPWPGRSHRPARTDGFDSLPGRRQGLSRAPGEAGLLDVGPRRGDDKASGLCLEPRELDGHPDREGRPVGRLDPGEGRPGADRPRPSCRFEV